MRKIFILWAMLITAFAVQAQNNETYLSKAFELLLEGNVKSAENHYIVYKKLSGKTDADFETMLQTEKANKENAWMDECYIIDIDNEYDLAVQKSSISEKAHKFHDAYRYARSSRLGGFTDWYLPDLNELTIVLANLPSGTIKPYGSKYTSSGWGSSYWAHTYRDKFLVYVIVRYSGYDASGSCDPSSCKHNFIIVRKFKKNN